MVRSAISGSSSRTSGDSEPVSFFELSPPELEVEEELLAFDDPLDLFSVTAFVSFFFPLLDFLLFSAFFSFEYVFF